MFAEESSPSSSSSLMSEPPARRDASISGVQPSAEGEMGIQEPGRGMATFLQAFLLSYRHSLQLLSHRLLFKAPQLASYLSSKHK